MNLELYRAFEPVLHFDRDDGKPLAGGWLCTFLGGTDTPVATYKDKSGTLNEVEIELDGRGECVVFLDNAKEYKFVLYGKYKDRPIWVKDHITTNMLFSEAPLYIDPLTRKISILPNGIGRDLLKNWHRFVPDSKYLQFKDFAGNVVVTLCDKLQEWLDTEGYVP